MSDTPKDETEQPQPDGGAGFGNTIIHDHLVTVIRHPNNRWMDEPNPKDPNKDDADEKPPQDAA